MNVSLKNIDATKGIVKLEIVKADYADKVEKSLRSFIVRHFNETKTF